MRKTVIFSGIIIALLLTAIAPIAMLAQPLAQPASPTDTMLQANQLYEASRFAEAEQLYQYLIDLGFDNPDIYFNLANAQFKQDDVGHSILNYRRAERLAPRDADIQANLELARAQTVDQINPDNQAPLSRLVGLAQTWLTLNEMASLALVQWILFILLLIGVIFLKPGSLRTLFTIGMVGVGIFLLAGLFSIGSRLYVEKTRPAAVIVAQEVDVTSGPGSQYIAEFTLHSGAEVTLMENRNRWARLALPGDQLQGWVPADAIEAVNIP